MRCRHVQSAEIRTNGSVAWAVQYHPEYPLREVAAIVRRIGKRLIEEGFFADEDDIKTFAARSRHARPRSGLQAAVLAARHQQEYARQEAARQRGGQLDRIPGAADAGDDADAKRMTGLAGMSSLSRVDAWRGQTDAGFLRHVVVTGGTGALGTAVVGQLLEAGATCTVPYRARGRGAALSSSRDPKVKLAVTDLADEAEVAKV